LFISLGRFRLIGTYNQFLYTLAIKSVTFVSASLIHLRNCSLLSPILPYLLVAPIPHLKHLPIFIYRCFLRSPSPFLIFLFSSVLLVDYLIIGTYPSRYTS